MALTVDLCSPEAWTGIACECPFLWWCVWCLGTAVSPGWTALDTGMSAKGPPVIRASASSAEATLCRFRVDPAISPCVELPESVVFPLKDTLKRDQTEN